MMPAPSQAPLDDPAQPRTPPTHQVLDHHMPSPTAISATPAVLAPNPSALEIQWHQDVIDLIRNLPLSLTEEQSILGLFCCHSIVSFDELLENQPSAKQIQLRFRDYIARLWTQWLNGAVKKDDMIANMFRWVRRASSLTNDLDIIEEFVSWFETQYANKHRDTSDKPQLSTMFSDNHQNQSE